jgi:hypothetical protein
VILHIPDKTFVVLQNVCPMERTAFNEYAVLIISFVVTFQPPGRLRDGGTRVEVETE